MNEIEKIFKSHKKIVEKNNSFKRKKKDLRKNSSLIYESLSYLAELE